MTDFSLKYISHGEVDGSVRAGLYVVKNATQTIVTLSSVGHALPARSLGAVNMLSDKLLRLIDSGRVLLIASPTDRKESKPRKQKSEDLQEISMTDDELVETWIKEEEEKSLTETIEATDL